MVLFRRYVTYILTIIIFLIFIILGLFNRELFDALIELIKKLWPAIIALLTFAGFVTVKGVLVKKPDNLDAVFDYIYVQIAVLLFFAFIVIVLFFAYRSYNTATLKIPVSSEPTTATIWLDDSIHSGRTPDTLYLKKRNTYKVTLKKPGYMDKSFLIDRHRKSFDEFRMIKLQKIWNVEFWSNYDTCEINLGEEEFLITNRDYNLLLPTGTYSMSWKSNGESGSEEINIFSDTVLLVPDDFD